MSRETNAQVRINWHAAKKTIVEMTTAFGGDDAQRFCEDDALALEQAAKRIRELISRA
jgi:hypothetical protein